MSEKNFLIVNNEKSSNNLCYIFCSSNGLFWGSRDEKFVLDNNYFEFVNICKDKRMTNFRKYIFLRDLDVSFYVNGINDEINCIGKLIEFLKKETFGLELIIVGVSAGGYLSNLLGIFLPNVKRVYSFGAVFDVRKWNGRHSYSESKYLVEGETDPEKNRFYNLYPLFKEKSESVKTKFFYFYASKNNYDIEIAKETRRQISDNNFVFVPVISKEHGVKLSYNCYISLLTTQKELHTKVKPYTKTGLLIYLIGLRKSIYCLLIFLKYKFVKFFNSIAMLKNKVKRYFQIKRALKYAKYLLANGQYYVDDKTICKLDANKNKHFYEKFKVKTKKKNITPVEWLYFTITKYKKIFVSEDQCYFYIKSRKRYELFKNNYSKYAQMLPYKHINLNFYDENKMVIGETAKGTKFRNNERFEETLNLLFDTNLSQEVDYKNLLVNDENIEVPFFVQHGDFKNSNVIWNETDYCLIDLEEVNEYPAFYDLFFYVFLSKPQTFIETLFSDFFINRTKNFWLSKNKDLHFDRDYFFVDYSLSIYLSFVLEKYKSEHTKEFFDYYLFWTSNRLVDDERLLLTKLVINLKLTRDKFFKKGLNK